MTYQYGFGDLSGLESKVGIARSTIVAPRRSIIPVLMARPAERRVLPDLSVMESIRRTRRSKLQQTAVLLSSRSSVAVPVARGIMQQAKGLSGFSGLGDGVVEAALGITDARRAFDELSVSEQGTIGSSMFTGRAAELLADMGIDGSLSDVQNSVWQQIALWTGQRAASGGSTRMGALFSQFGSQISTLFRSQGGTVDELLSIAQTVQQKFGAAWNDAGRVLGDLGGIIEGGVRDTMDSIFGSGSTSQWLNSQTIGAVSGIVSDWSSTNFDSPASIAATTLETVGAVIAVVGAFVPQPAGAIVSAVGAVISIIGALIDLFMGSEGPPPPVMPCSTNPKYTMLRDPDAWAVLRLFLHAQGEPRTTTLDDLSSEWDARFDPHTGEVLVVPPGINSGNGRRILDVFDRRIILDAFRAGAFTAWIDGSVSIPGADPVLQGSGSDRSDWLNSSDYAQRRAIYCSISENDVRQRGFLADTASTAHRYRVYGEEWGIKADANTKHGPYAIGWRGWMGTPGDSWFWRNYRMAQIVTAFLGGTAPYGQYKYAKYGSDPERRNPAICTGVGARSIAGSESRYKYPFTIAWAEPSGNRYRILLHPPYSRSSITPDFGHYNPEGEPELIPFEDVAEAVLSNDTQRQEWNVPTTTPKRSEIPPERIIRASTHLRPVMMKSFIPGDTSSHLDAGMSTGSKVALIAGGLVLLGGGGYALARMRKR